MTDLCRCILFVLFLNDWLFVVSKTCTEFQLNTFELKILEYHNLIRFRHEDTPALCWSKKLSEAAHQWANHLVENRGVLKSSDNGYISGGEDDDDLITVKIVRYGENLYKQTIFTGGITEQKAALDSVTHWNNQESEYRYTIPRHAGLSRVVAYSTKYFTQLVWAASQDVGCGYAVRKNGYFIVVCNYYPEGNSGAPSDYRRNVKPIKSCPAPDINYGKATEKGPYYLKQEITIECNDGFKLKGGSGRGVCRSAGFDFGDVQPRCTGCIVPGISNGTSDYPSGFVVDDQSWVTYKCNNGYFLDDSIKVVKCDGNDLIQAPPRCRQSGHCLRPIIEHGYAYAPSVDDKMELYEQYKQNIPEGANITVVCARGYELIGNGTARCTGNTFGDIGHCRQYATGPLSNAPQRTYLSHLLLLLITFLFQPGGVG